MGKRVGLVLNMSAYPIYAIGVAVLLIKIGIAYYGRMERDPCRQKRVVWSIVASWYSKPSKEDDC